MSGKQRHHKKHVEKSCSSSSSESDREYIEKKVEKVEKIEKIVKKDKHRREKSRSRSCSSKSSSSESDRKDCKEKKNRKNKDKCEKSSSESRSSKCSERSKSRSRSRSRSCSSNGHKRFEFQDIYNYMKNRLVEDEELMVTGSNAYANSVNNLPETIPSNHVVVYNSNVINYNIDYIKLGSPFFVRKSGVYIIFFVTSIDTAAQFTIFVNGEVIPSTCVGTNAGAGQIINRAMLKLKENDNVIIRNYISTSATIFSNINSGGSQTGNSSTCLLMKIAPYCAAEVDECEEKRFYHHLSQSNKRLFKALQGKLETDNELMMKGFNITGTFYTKVSQTVALEGDVVFDTTDSVNELIWNNVAPTQVTIKEDGVYKLFFVLNTNTAAQFAIAVNGVAVETTTQGSNKGAGQISSRALLPLKKNDVVTVRNHSSLLGPVVISQNAGGLQSTVAAILTVFKISTLLKPVVKEVPCHVEKKLACLYERFRTYLLYKDELQITGSSAYVSVVKPSLQTVNQSEPFYFSTIVQKKDIDYRPGDYQIEIKESGVYDVFADVATNESIQLALFVNGVATTTTIFGRDSGANRCLLRQFIALKQSDVVTLCNYLSASPSVTTVENAGGNFIGNSVVFMAFKLRNLNVKEE